VQGKIRVSDEHAPTVRESERQYYNSVTRTIGEVLTQGSLHSVLRTAEKMETSGVYASSVMG
jgi:hypothetical protein